MLLISSTKQAREIFVMSMEEQFEITKKFNDLSYLGMAIQKTAEEIKVHQSGYIETMMTKFGADSNSSVSSSTGTDFLTLDSEDKEVNKTKYIGLIVSLMFLACVTRSDILMPVTYLAIKLANPRQKDLKKGITILNYIFKTKSRHILFYSISFLELHVFTDASHMLHIYAVRQVGIR